MFFIITFFFPDNDFVSYFLGRLERLKNLHYYTWEHIKSSLLYIFCICIYMTKILLPIPPWLPIQAYIVHWIARIETEKSVHIPQSTTFFMDKQTSIYTERARKRKKESKHQSIEHQEEVFLWTHQICMGQVMKMYAYDKKISAIHSLPLEGSTFILKSAQLQTLQFYDKPFSIFPWTTLLCHTDFCYIPTLFLCWISVLSAHEINVIYF
jgi:hypothetical protein